MDSKMNYCSTTFLFSILDNSLISFLSIERFLFLLKMRLSELVVLLLALSTLTFAKKTSRFQKRRFPKATLQPRDDGDGEDDGPFCLNGLKPSKVLFFVFLKKEIQKKKKKFKKQKKKQPVGQPGLCPQFVTSSCCLPYEDADYADQYDNYLSLGKVLIFFSFSIPLFFKKNHLLLLLGMHSNIHSTKCNLPSI